MDSILDIVKKEHLQQEELQYVVEQFIKEKKGEDVTINIQKKLSTIPNIFHHQFLVRQLEFLHAFYHEACIYFLSKETT